MKNMSLKCKKFGVKNIFISGLVYTNRINIGILEKIHDMIQNFCQEYGWFYVDNRNIRGKHLYKDRLHLMEEGKMILGRNLIFCLNKATWNYFVDYNFFRQAHTSFNCQDLKEDLSEETGLQQLQEDKLKHCKNPLIGYLNINSLRNKITLLRVIMKTLPLDYFVLNETKIDESFPTSKFNVEAYGIRARRDRDKYGGGLIEFVRRGLICKKLRDYESKYSECLCSELTFTNKKWICFSIYRPPKSSNLSTFFEELTKSLSKTILKYENLLIIGDFNIGMKSKNLGYDKLDEFYNLFNLTNLIKSETCFTKNHKSLVDLFLTNTPLSFQKNTCK